MKNLLVWQKLALLGAVFLLPLIAVTYALVSSVYKLGVTAARQELLGVEYASAILPVLHDLQLFQGLGAVSGPAAAGLEMDRAKVRRDLESRLARVDQIDARLSKPLQMPGEWPTLAADIRKALAQAATGERRDQVPRVSRATLGLLGKIGDQSALTLDPALGSYYFVDLMLWTLPEHAAQVTNGWSQLAANPPGQPLAAATRSELERTAGVVAYLHRRAKLSLTKAFEAARPQRGFAFPAEPGEDPINQALMTGALHTAPAELARQMIARIDADHALAAQTGVALTELLHKRIAGLHRRLVIFLAAAVAGLLIVSAFGWRLIHDITRPLGDLATTARAIGGGELDARVTVEGRRDEIGELADALRRMIAAQRQSREQLVENNVAMLAANEKLQTKTMEAQRLAVEADAANRAKRDFLAVMSHEIRTPMNGIIGMTELALNTALTDTQREYLDMVKGSAETLLELLNDILDFSKIEAGRLELERTDFELRDLLGDTMQALGVRANTRGLELALQVRPDVPDALVGDPHRLRQIIVNLVGNALKFTERGEVTVLVENSALQASEAALRFTVRDTGIGIPVEAHRRIFHAFSQADSSTTRRFGGTGLGLAITSQLVRLMGGTIEVESAVGQGSTFLFTAHFGRQAESPEEMVPELEQLRVLAVDDNATNRHILRELFMSWRMDVVVADSALAALAALEDAHARREPITLVVTDMMMPEIDGFGLVERMQQSAALRETRVIMLTSSNRAEDVARGERLGIGAHLAKPIKQSVLMDSIVSVLGYSSRRRRIAGTGDVPRQRPLRILIAEDNAVNQRLAVVNLEAWGHKVTVAHDGLEAVEAASAQSFDVILMDSQMPRMSGFEATAEIRQRERGSGARVPIVAMTANVMKGYRDDCLAAGMDGYVAKPMRRHELISELAAVLPGFILESRITAPAPEPAAELHDTPAFDQTALLNSMDGNREVLAEMARLCLDVDAPRLLDDLRTGLEKHDAEIIEHAAHGLKGLVGEFHAPAVYAAARELEKSAREKRPGVLPPQAETLLREFERFAGALRKYLGG